LRRYWGLLSRLPGGKRAFSRVLGGIAPYSGSIGACVRILEPGRCVATLRERRAVRNHLHSVHAMALANLGELVTGLALMNSLPDNTRGILTAFSIEYLKKARGRLTAECRCPVPVDNTEQTVTLGGEIADLSGDIVTRVEARWLIGPQEDGLR
jgi:acyl-coenzyme A thioesterase PaaI-like protein